jgi:hypothetical protein
MTADFSRQRNINLQGSHHLSSLILSPFFDIKAWRVSKLRRPPFLTLLLCRLVVPFTVAGAGAAIQTSVRTACGCTGYIVCTLGWRRILVGSFLCEPVRVPVRYGVAWRCSYIHLRPSSYKIMLQMNRVMDITSPGPFPIPVVPYCDFGYRPHIPQHSTGCAIGGYTRKPSVWN